MASRLQNLLGLPRLTFLLARRQAPLFLGAATLSGFILAGAIGLIVYLHALQIAEGQRGASNLAYVLSDETDRSLQSVSSAVSSVADRLGQMGLTSQDALRVAASGADFRAALLERVGQNAVLDSLFVVVGDGRIVDPAFDGAFAPSSAVVHDFISDMRRLEPEAVHVSTPFQSGEAGTWLVNVSKRVSARDGAFLGAVSGVARLASVGDLLEKVALGEHGSISIFRDDGSIIACYPQREIAFSGGVRKSDLYKQIIDKDADGVTSQTSAIDGVERMLAVVHSPKFPIVSVVAVGMSAVVAEWRRQAEALVFCAGLVVLAIAFGAIMLAVHVEQLAQAREREALRAQEAIQYARFNNAMDNIVQGVAMYDRDNALTDFNKRYAEIYGLAIDNPGASSKKGRMPSARVERAGAKILVEPRAEPDGGVMSIAELPDGRVIAQRKKKLSDGGWVSTHEDITARYRAEEKIKEMATSDALTGLSNRFEFKRRLEQSLGELRRTGAQYAVFYLDLDAFKNVNDTLGHPVGDKLLREVAARIKACVRQGDTVARLGGDEFAIIQRVVSVPRDPMKLAERLIGAIRKPFTIDGNHIEIATSIGVSLAPSDSMDPDELIRDADMALYHSKADKSGCKFFQSSMDEQAQARRGLENDLRAALAEGQFELHFQPVVGVMGREVLSFEALLRWKHPARGFISPAEFIPIAEENGLIVPIGEWVLNQACREAAKWPGHIKVAVNVSVVQFRSPGLLKAFTQALAESGLEGSRLIAEVTESVMIKDAEQAISTLHALRAMGIVIAMDDFGTGYSSLSYLRRFPFDKIKIDKSFVGELGEREDSAAIVRAATGLAKALGMQTVAEGVETEEQLSIIGLEGCSEAQGYLISRPLPAARIAAFLGVEFKEPAPRPALASASRAQEAKPGSGNFALFAARARARGPERAAG